MGRRGGPKAKMPHVEHVRRLCVGRGVAKLRTVRSRARAREKDWSVRAGDRGAAGPGELEQWQNCLTGRN